MTHLTWSLEVGGKCPCGGEVVLVYPCQSWTIAEMDQNPEGFEGGLEMEVDDEVAGHVCTICNRLTSLSLNTRE